MAKVTLLRDYNAGGGSILEGGTELDVDLAQARTLVGDGNARWTAITGSNPSPSMTLRRWRTCAP
jgi:hypothetical protein